MSYDNDNDSNTSYTLAGEFASRLLAILDQRVKCLGGLQ
jgi:hypothetical protein